MPKLTAAFVRSVTKPGKYGDQHGLILRVQPTGSKQWIWRGTIGGRRQDLGLGGYPYVSLSEARAKAFEYKRTARAGGDPTRLHPDQIPTFRAAAEAVIALHAGKWKPGGKSEAQWRSSLATYVTPLIGTKRVHEITTADVMACLVPIWTTKPETAKRVRQRISAIMKWAIAEGHRSDNPAADAVTAALPKQNSVGRKHHRALPHHQVADALATVRQSAHPLMVRLAFEFLILTAARSTEVRGATWSEINLNTATWTIPAQRMKAARQHRVPLSEKAIEVLAEARRHSDGSPWIFPTKTGEQIPSWVLTKLPTRLNLEGTLHGMRSTFRDWCGEQGIAREVAEGSLAHRIGNAAEQAYARSDLLQRRRQLMETWAQYTNPK
ncbi:MAG: integrase arm-type DNA-binding domain-containing protein [bacterium]|nr:integrase arm-type DNA-binding domain-containing protein [bacterium]MDE0351118.1 integrase arm-type DNA-binding domain-containing protein [bacterium]